VSHLSPREIFDELQDEARQGHDRLERERRSVSIVAIGDAADGRKSPFSWQTSNQSFNVSFSRSAD
jgi:hypothetical protein